MNSNLCTDTQNKLLNVASLCNDRMQEIYNDSQESLGKFATKYYSSEQHDRMMNAVKNKEDIKNMTEISSYVYTDEIIKLYHELDRAYQSESEYALFVCIQWIM